MPDTMLTRDEIFKKVQEVLEEALGADEDEISLDTSLTRDLEAESIDFLDIVFRLEKTFTTGDKPFKVEQGELFPENLTENPDWVQDGLGGHDLAEGRGGRKLLHLRAREEAA